MYLQQGDSRMNYKDALMEGLKKSFDFKGTETRSGFWWFAIIYYPMAIISFILIILTLLSVDMVNMAFFVRYLGAIIITIPLISAIVRRLHDVGKKWYFSILWFIPIGNLYLFYLLAQKSMYKNKI